ncbi:MAG: shikimate kinase / 3-dehydroquinate synthase [Thermoleophilaceae bacterium]|nr:shikimate kinase / 3-dehydroquinate synthase [Thermoleophilaceae bacterium]
MEPQVAASGTIVLVGFMGAGKSTGARSLAAELGAQALDSDRELERRIGEPIESFFDREGEAAFRSREEDVVCELLARDDARVIALGGGAVQSERVRDALVHHTVVHLEIDPEDAWRRASGKGRPLARDPGRFGALWRDRRALYESVADAVVPPSDRDALRRALPSVRALRDAPPGTRLVWAGAESGDYPVFLGRGLIEAGFFPGLAGRRFVVTDENVARLQRVEGDDRIVVMPGEEHKTIHGAEHVLRSLAQGGAERGDLVVAVGGGVVGDLAGFCAAVYQRGMRHVQVPTTLVAQVDSAYGGKTGVDLPEGKNYAGVYHQPSAVLCDPAALDTLPVEEAAAGYAEVVKTALIAGGGLWARVRQGGPVAVPEIMGCVRTKLAVVAEDERDGGRRQVLNLGHTVGHAIEAATGYARYRHGEAVGIGLLAALRLSDRDSLRAEVSELLAARGLPLAFTGASVDDVLALVERDKKREGGRVPFVLVGAPGEVTPGHEIDTAVLRAAVEEVREG